MSKKRLLVSLEENILNKITELANHNNISSSKVASQLITTSLELQEDQLFSNIADQRLAKTKKWVSHDDVWQ